MTAPIAHEYQASSLTLPNSLSGRIAHELRSPLGVVQGVLQTLEAGQDPEDGQRLLSMANRALVQIAKIADRLTLLAQLQQHIELRKQPTRLAEVMAAAEQDVASVRSHRKVTLTVRVDPRRVVYADPDQLRQCLRELLDNAVRFARHAVTIEAQSTPNELFLRIENDGPALDSHIAANLFGRVELPLGPGLGIGLTLAAEIARLHSGILWLDQNEEGSVAFTMRIPERA